MKVTKAEIVISAVSEKQYPNDRLPEIALAGRSNVGKSSFINTLINRKNLARTSSKPGKTQTLNFYRMNDAFYFVDVPGYGYAKVSKKERQKWGRMMEEYFGKRSSLQAVLLITDIRHEPTSDDLQMYDFLKYYELPVIIVATKLDKISKNKRSHHVKRTGDAFQLEAGDFLLPFSAETGEGKEEAWAILRQFMAL
ncbi:ribosome biogenesis GTP-binding protein YihA/YsxC [Virgibacillus pantothenticus]|uniref:ribosome biogenesis GTP-binding protein YihA/YsxC n=1 Tax=Virgibacillus pantothenticus TaxID=1473 RepID=UPI001C2402AD|nr:ribosome biogenesis GTP-binding protein YihA/YsxC [Virgibacillus pantothenticus]MBU8566197.1 ribosome biogenesis GTP-binding protein YihA/YsxC [Virgibacillus pantothenticus]MBU8600507.1 ribosome biogenesis GTP-binding protein YihA/YsxC [Virgibacillus pantothenticus]MBU8634517.1 ribosome biogenesis GTP-binding protein YihA/YsxC [Virgibacillus pantothenticus]MBU8642645.1 ribosome biogenesis GTP-binding protein YihA/YsxC [Virgibacillus pantothenticus]MBU8647059.1 ribosome biogenesis GTP-bindin